MERFNGNHGLVCLMDRETNERARALSGAEIPSSTGLRTYMDFTPEVPHITLFSAMLLNVPITVVRDLVQGLSSGQRWRKHPIHFTDTVAEHEGRLLLWNVAPSPNLVEAHGVAATGLEPFISENSRAWSSYIASFTLPAAECESVRRYGRPDVGKLYNPQMVLGSRNDGLEGLPIGSTSHDGYVERVVFAKIGRHGCMTEIVPLF